MIKTGRLVIAFDAQSKRHKDENGFLHVSASHITREQVAPYYGFEIPNFDKLGLKPNKIYKGYRSAEELQKAVKTINGLPLTLHHHIESADEPQKKYRVGSLGTSATWNPPFLDNALTITDKVGIDAVESGQCREISLAYLYDPDFTAGEHNGEPYDFVMRNIRGNHAALVEEGRAGSQVVVADSQINSPLSKGKKMLKDLRNFFSKYKGALDSDPMADEKDLLQDNDNAEQIKKLVGELAKDVDPDKIADFLDSMKPKAEDEETTEPKVVTDPEEPKEEEAKGEESEENPDEETLDEDQVDESDDDDSLDDMDLDFDPMADDDEDESDKSDESLDEDLDDDDENPVDPKAEKEPAEDEDDMDELDQEAMDALKENGYDSDSGVKEAFVKGFKYGKEKAAKAVGGKEAKLAQDAALEKRAIASIENRFKAAQEVQATVGKVNPMAFDSARDIYIKALDTMGVKRGEYKQSSARDVYRAIVKTYKTKVAQDTGAFVKTATKEFTGKFAGLNKYKR